MGKGAEWTAIAVLAINEWAREAACPMAESPWLFLNARSLPCPPAWCGGFQAEQGFRPDHDRLAREGYQVSPQLDAEAGRYHGALVLCGRSRKLNEINLARASAAVRPGAPVIACGPKNTGVQALRKWAGSNGVVGGSLSKHHAVAFLIEGGSLVHSSPATGGTDAGETDLPAGPGMFSANQPDAGSLLLARFITPRIQGSVADFGAGWGFLSMEIAGRAAGVRSIDLYEADHASLEAARHNMAAARHAASERNAAFPDCRYHWADLAGSFERRPFDWVIMNPPFHHGLHGGRDADTGLGQTFIEAARSCLPQGGRLLMVANRKLPYEKVVTRLFRRHEILAEEAGYKVIEAVR